MNRKKLAITFVSLLFLLYLPAYLFYYYGRSIWYPKVLDLKGKRTVSDVIDHYGLNAEARLKLYFKNAGVKYPPERIALIGFKDKRALDIWAQEIGKGSFDLVHTYKILGASGVLGPKLREGDQQVPEGIYSIEGFNPNSSYHLSMKLNYPNPFDLKYAKTEGRTEPGSNIFIHGKSLSVGCLAMGDRAIEELFVLSYMVGRKNIEVILAPTNLVSMEDTTLLLKDKPAWVGILYDDIRHNLRKFYKD